MTRGKLLKLLLFLARWLTIAPFHAVIVSGAINQVRRAHRDRSPAIVGTLYYGATYLDPRHLVVWYLVSSDAALQDARNSGVEARLVDDTKAALARRGYSRPAIEAVHVGMESRERIKAGGGWRYFK